MDYTIQPLLFKFKKALRYIKLYGPRRTLAKIEGQYHMKKKYDTFPPKASKPGKGKNIGIIGCGNFSYSTIAYYLRKNYGDVIHWAMDKDINRAASLYEKYNLNYYTDNADELISDPQIDLIYIATNHSSHTEYAIQALEAGKAIHIEKPHVVNEDQLFRLCSAMYKCRGVVGLGFNRPNSLIGKKIKQFLDSQSGPAMYNWFIAGHEITPDHWYFKEEEGGRILGNLCHWTDFVYQLVDCQNRYPLTIRPTRAEKSDCDIAVTYTFGDSTIAAITFSAKGHTFEGVRERFAAHRGNILISMDDFRYLLVEILDKKHKIKLPFRDHGHEVNICRSYEMAKKSGENNLGCSIKHVWETGQLFLKTKEALERDEIITLKPFDNYSISGKTAISV